MNDHLQNSGVKSIDREPWVQLQNGKELCDWSKKNEIAYNQINRQRQKYEYFKNAFDFITSLGIDGDYYEFGCHRARTFRMALTEARRHGLEQMRYYAFDSFHGLPKTRRKTGVKCYYQGALTTSENEFMRLVNQHGIYVNNIRIIQGYYNNSLTKRLQAELLSAKRKIAFVNVDCDLYESAVPVFKFITPLIQEGSVIYIDDYYAGFKGSPVTGPALAFYEYEKMSKFRFAEHMQIGWWGRSFIAYLEK